MIADTMARKKPNPDAVPQPAPEPEPEPRKSSGGRHQHPKLGFHLEQSLLDAFNEFCETQKPRVDKSEWLRIFLEEGLNRRGAWPPKEGGR